MDNDFAIITSTEALIQNHGMEVALERARMYNDCGPDGFLIHSKKKTPKEIFDFAKQFRKEFKDIPLVCVPTSYNNVKEIEFEKKVSIL